MGLITAAGASLSSVLGDQWKDYFYCSEMDTNVLVRKGQKHNGKSGLLNRGGSENVITNGSTIVVNEGQCMIIVDQGAIVDICAQAGAYTYDTSTEPSVFTGGLGEGILKSFEQFKARFAYGGVTPHDQRIYYFNTKDIIGNKYGTANPVPFRVVDKNIGLDVDIAIRCFGEYSYRLSDPILFYKNICGNVNSDYTKDRIENQLRTELLTALQPAFGKISEMGIRYSAVVNHTTDMANALNEVLSDSWGAKYGIVIEDRCIPERRHGRRYEGQCGSTGYDGRSQEPQRSGYGLLRNGYGTAGSRRRNRCSFPVRNGRAAEGSQGSQDAARRLEVP